MIVGQIFGSLRGFDCGQALLALGEDGLQREGRAKLNVDSPHADGYLSRHLQEPQAQRTERGPRQLGAAQTPGPQPFQQQIRKGAQPQAHLVAAEPMRGGAIALQIQGHLFDLILGLSPLAVDFFVEPAALAFEQSAPVRAHESFDFRVPPLTQAPRTTSMLSTA